MTKMLDETGLLSTGGAAGDTLEKKDDGIRDMVGRLSKAKSPYAVREWRIGSIGGREAGDDDS